VVVEETSVTAFVRGLHVGITSVQQIQEKPGAVCILGKLYSFLNLLFKSQSHFNNSEHMLMKGPVWSHLKELDFVVVVLLILLLCFFVVLELTHLFQFYFVLFIFYICTPCV
jgi:hypothetical protein